MKRWIFLLLFALAWRVEAGQRVFDVGDVGDYACLLPAVDAGKLYAGRNANAAANQIIIDVFDLDAKGNPSPSPKTYEVAVPPPVDDKHATQARTVTALARHPNKKKLYFGFSESVANRDPVYLGVWDLGPKGEPVGKPRLMYNGNKNHSLTGIFVDEKDKILYMIGWGMGLFGYPLDDNGEPKGESFTKEGFNYGSYSSLPSEDFSSIIYGGYTQVAYALLDHKATSGPFEKPPEHFKVTGDPSYVTVACAGRSLYVADFSGDPAKSLLNVWPLDDARKPQGLGAVVPKVHPFMMAHGTRLAAYVATHPVGGGKGFQLLRFEQTPPGETPVAKSIGSEFEGLTLKTIAVDEGSGNIYICARP